MSVKITCVEKIFVENTPMAVLGNQEENMNVLGEDKMSDQGMAYRPVNFMGPCPRSL